MNCLERSPENRSRLWHALVLVAIAVAAGCGQSGSARQAEVAEGRRRRVYRATVKGRRTLVSMRRALQELADEVLD